MMRRLTKWSAALVLAAGLALAGYVGIQEVASGDEVAADPEEPLFGSAVAELRTLSESHEVEGVIAYDTALPLAAPVDGTVREVAEASTSIVSGDVLVRVDDVAVVWLEGAIPAWRTMQSGDSGPDVEQLERALVDLGFDPDGVVEVYEDFDGATESMVEAWQESINVQPTGSAEFGTVVFGGVRNRVAAASATVGTTVRSGDEVMALDNGTRLVTFEATPKQAVDLEPGQRVSVSLPDGSAVEAEIESELPGTEAVTVVASFGGVELPARDPMVVEVRWVRDIVDPAVTVPSSALLRLDNGTYVVDVVRSDGTLERRPVEIGTSVGTRTEVRLGLTAGDEVRVL